MQLFGVKLVGLNAANGHKILLTLVFITAVFLLRYVIHALARRVLHKYGNPRAIFWFRQAINLATAIVIVLSILSIWFDDPSRLATGAGLFTAGLAFALQKVVTSLAGYIVIMRGKTFTVGDRITLGGVRGDVVSLGFIQTTIMEMGQPPSVQNADPAMWVRARQYTGRIVTVTNDKIFEEPVYNYTRDFPFIWEEIKIPVKYNADRKKAEEIILRSVSHNSENIHKLSLSDQKKLERKFLLKIHDFTPRVYYHLTDNWLELTVRFIVRDHGIRSVKDCINREILDEFDRAHIEIASSTYDIVGMPPLQIKLAQPSENQDSDLKRAAG
jgi:small-conductance mechanosensitive channel